jgi:ribosome modulation factor
MDENPWKTGFKAGRLGQSLDACPDYAEAEFWNWYCGFLSGRCKPLRAVGEDGVVMTKPDIFAATNPSSR